MWPFSKKQENSEEEPVRKPKSVRLYPEDTLRVFKEITADGSESWAVKCYTHYDFYKADNEKAHHWDYEMDDTCFDLKGIKSQARAEAEILRIQNAKVVSSLMITGDSE